MRETREKVKEGKSGEFVFKPFISLPQMLNNTCQQPFTLVLQTIHVHLTSLFITFDIELCCASCARKTKRKERKTINANASSKLQIAATHRFTHFNRQNYGRSCKCENHKQLDSALEALDQDFYKRKFDVKSRAEILLVVLSSDIMHCSFAIKYLRGLIYRHYSLNKTVRETSIGDSSE